MLEPGRSGGVPRTLLVVGGGVLALVVVVAVGARLLPGPAGPRSPDPAAAPATGHRVESGATLELSLEELPPDAPVRVSLLLGVPSTSADPRPVRVIAEADRRVLETEGHLDAERGAATFEIEPGWLQPGRYVVEVRTTERSHFPLRRYAIQVGTGEAAEASDAEAAQVEP